MFAIFETKLRVSLFGVSARTLVPRELSQKPWYSVHTARIAQMSSDWLLMKAVNTNMSFCMSHLLSSTSYLTS